MLTVLIASVLQIEKSSYDWIRYDACKITGHALVCEKGTLAGCKYYNILQVPDSSQICDGDHFTDIHFDIISNQAGYIRALMNIGSSEQCWISGDCDGVTLYPPDITLRFWYELFWSILIAIGAGGFLCGSYVTIVTGRLFVKEKLNSRNG